MAKAGGRSRRSGDGSADSSRADGDRIIDAALALVATEGWRRLSLAAIAARAELPILQVYRIFRSKPAILCGLHKRVDAIVLAEPPSAEPDERPRDRLFDLLMRRFDALQPYKTSLEVLRRELQSDPVTALCLGTSFLRSMRWMLEAADIPTGGLRGAIALRLTCAAYLSTARVWQRDDSPDLTRTMAALDARLRRIERWFTPATGTRRDNEPLPA
jgi:AcrR family transcriptional regulator